MRSTHCSFFMGLYVRHQSELKLAGILVNRMLHVWHEPESILRSVAAKIEEIPECNTRANLAATTSILAGLVLDKDRIQRILRSDIMKESVMYQEFLAEAKAEAESGERQLVLRLLNRKIGNLTPQLLDRVSSLSIDRIESLGEALLDFNALADLETWLALWHWQSASSIVAVSCSYN